MEALTVYNDELIAGGWFTHSGGLPVWGIARWNGATWSSLGSGMSAPVYELETYNGELYAAGLFSAAGGVSVNGFARWNGSIWQTVGDWPRDGETIGDMIVFDGKLLVGGYLNAEQGYIDVWDGSIWTSLPQTNFCVFTLGIHQGRLIAGGNIGIGNKGQPRIARWNPVAETWDPLGTAITSGSVADLVSYNEDLIACGSFTEAGGYTVNHIARWNGSYWQPLSSGMAHPPNEAWVGSLIVFGERLVAGGDFTEAGGNAVNNIASWKDCNFCLADATLDHQVNVADLLTVINSWGPCPAQPIICPGDVWPAYPGDGVVDALDLGYLMIYWGPCQPPPQPCLDFTFDGVVNSADMLVLINAWGPCPPMAPPVPSPGDTTHDGAVNTADLLAVINSWGACP